MKSVSHQRPMHHDFLLPILPLSYQYFEFAVVTGCLYFVDVVPAVSANVPLLLSFLLRDLHYWHSLNQQPPESSVA